MELELAHSALNLSIETLQGATVAALDAGFNDWTTRERLVREVVEPAYSAAAP